MVVKTFWSSHCIDIENRDSWLDRPTENGFWLWRKDERSIPEEVYIRTVRPSKLACSRLGINELHSCCAAWYGEFKELYSLEGV